MKKALIGLGLALFSQQLLAVTTVAGVDFLDIATTLDASVGSYSTNYNPGGAGTEQNSVVDGNAASWVFSDDLTATLDLSFGGGVFNVTDVDLSILFVGDGGHAGSIQLLGGDQSGSINQLFNIGPGVGYTGFNSSTDNPPTVNGGMPSVYGIFATNLHLADVFTGTFSGVRLSIGGASAVPSMVGTIAPVPVPAAVWLFGSGLLGLVGVMRRRAA